MKELEKKIYGSQETDIKKINKAYNYRLPKYDVDFLGQELMITGLSYLGKRIDSHGTTRAEWLLTVFANKMGKSIKIVSHHAYVREIIKHFRANPNTPLRCRIITQGEAQAKRYRLAEPMAEESTE